MIPFFFMRYASYTQISLPSKIDGLAESEILTSTEYNLIFIHPIKKPNHLIKIGSPAISEVVKRIRPVTFRPCLTTGLAWAKQVVVQYY